MFYNTVFLALYLSALVQANPVAIEPRANTIQWAPCELNKTIDTQCGSLSVPLDYSNTSDKATIDLEIVKVPAKNKPSKGSIFLNFGGPGASGTADLAALGGQIRDILGGYHDLINISPRGTGNTLPFSCYANNTLRLAAATAPPVIAGRSSDTAQGQMWAKADVFTQTCAIAQNKTGRFIGTAFTARDIISVADALGEDGLVRYWGISYGTLLGSTLISMFPERIDRALIDGVVNPHEYYHQVEAELYTDTDAAFAAFCSDCIAAPARCPAARNRSITDLKIAVFGLLQDLRSQPLVVPLTVPGGGSTVDYSFMRNSILTALYWPTTWMSFAVLLDNVMTKNTTAIGAYFVAQAGKATTTLENEAISGIKGGDTFVRLPSLATIQPTLRARWELSRLGSDASDYPSMVYAQWPFAAKERYKGDFNVKTRHPVLLINNEYDPVTPLISAKNVSSGFEGSVVLEQKGAGHTTHSQMSPCTGRAIRAYFVNGTLPQPGTVCEQGYQPMALNNGWREVIRQLG